MGTSPGTWSGAPDPSGDSRKFLWFLMVATDGSTTEGPWGKASGGLERTGPGAQGSSGQCGANAKNTSSTCGSAPLMAEGQNEAWTDTWGDGSAEGLAVPESTPLQNPTAYFYAWDHLGTVRLVTDSVGAVVDQHDFEPYGVEIRPLQNASLNTLRYTGYERDEATGLDYAHFRFLASTLGRFMKPDNIMGNPQNPQSWNLYSYVQGNPVNFNDPTGHMTGIPYRGYYSAGGDIAGSCGNHMFANEWGGGLGLGQHPLDAGFGPGNDSWYALAELAAWGRTRAAATNAAAPATGGTSTYWGDFSLTLNPPNGGQPLSPSPQALSAIPVPSLGASVLYIRWELSKRSKRGGWIIQEIFVGAPNPAGHPPYVLENHYWEAWPVVKNTQHTYLFGWWSYDDKFMDPPGYKVIAHARFYEGLDLPPIFKKGAVQSAGNATWSTYQQPDLPAPTTLPVNREWIAP